MPVASLHAVEIALKSVDIFNFLKVMEISCEEVSVTFSCVCLVGWASLVKFMVISVDLRGTWHVFSRFLF